MKPVLQFQRYELKYYLDEQCYPDIVRLIRPYMELDPYSQKQETKSYLVRSLYLDTEDKKFYHEKLDGLITRKKFRVRGYNVSYSDVFLEIKRKYSNLVVKQRVAIEFDKLPDILDGYGAYQPDYHNRSEKEINTIDTFVTLVQVLQLRPMVLIAYEREAYMGIFDGGARLTFDRNIRCLPGDRMPELFYSGKDWFYVNNRCILELKFNNTLPSYFSRLIKKLNLWAEAISKYCIGIETCEPILLK